MVIAKLLGFPLLVLGLSQAPVNATTKVSQLPDGNHRYCQNPQEESKVSPTGILMNSGFCFSFRKQNQQVVGKVYKPHSGFIICVAGKVDQEVIKGTALEFMYGLPKAPLPDPTPSRLHAWDKKADFLQVGNYVLSNIKRERGYSAWVRYQTAELSLQSLHRYNAGTVTPPRSCSTKS